MSAIDFRKAIELEQICVDKSIELLDSAVTHGHLPTRSQHLWLTLKTAGKEIWDFLTRIANIFADIFYIICIPLCEHADKRKLELAYRVTRLFILDPMHLIFKSVSLLIRLGGTILGVGVVYGAAWAWKKAEQIESFNLKAQVHITDKFGLAPPTPWQDKPIDPKGAIDYLGKDGAYQAEESRKKEKDPEAIAKQHEAMCEQLSIVLVKLLENPDIKAEDLINKDQKHVPEWFAKILPELERNRASSDFPTICRKDIKALDLNREQVEMLVKHLDHLRLRMTADSWIARAELATILQRDPTDEEAMQKIPGEGKRHHLMGALSRHLHALEHHMAKRFHFGHSKCPHSGTPQLVASASEQSQPIATAT
jgi:hypothetical protein